MPDRETGADELYVGYLPVPQGQRRFLRLGLPLVLWIACGATFLWARSCAAWNPIFSWSSAFHPATLAC